MLSGEGGLNVSELKINRKEGLSGDFEGTAKTIYLEDPTPII